MSGREFAVAGRRIGPGAPVFVVAEAGVNHNGERALARRLVDAAAEAGADAVKFQTFSTEALVSRDAPKANYQREATGEAGSQGEMLARLELDAGAHREIRDRCAERGLVFFSTPFDAASADLLERLGVPCFKLGSGEITNLPFLRHVGAKGKPVIVSTGMSTLDEVAQAVAALREAGEAPLALLHCLSAYPAPAAEMNLRAMDTLSQRFGCPVGLSDHTSGIEIAVAAVARGAAIIEKHLTLDKGLPGPDHRASLDPGEFAALVRATRCVEAALGDGRKRPMPAEADTRRVARKSLVAARAITAGQRLAAADVAIKRPGTGISPADLPRALGRVVRRDVAPDEVIGWETLGEP
ncbi:MAG: N-acetylneuraminate synthase [Candidatus Rokubacteria bacterium]|nr:N-acetylneuraminate synthase [Candidatus Rokubacteria bacterium]